MAFAVREFRDLIRVLETHPEWREELRRHVLTPELLALPQMVRDLAIQVQAMAEFQRRQYEEYTALRAETDRRFQELAELQRRQYEDYTALRAETDRRFQELADLQRRQYEEFAAFRTEMVGFRAETDRRFQELTEAQRGTQEEVHALAEAQRRTEGRIDRLEGTVQALTAEVHALAEAQRRTEESVEHLGEAQRRTEESVEHLGEAQRRTEESVERLGEVVGRLQETLGATAEEEAEGILMTTLEARGYQLVGEPYTLPLDGEVDVVQQVRDPAGKRLWALAEVKVRLGWRGIEAWANRMQSEGFRRRLAEAGVPGPYLVYAFGLRVEQRAREAARTFRIGLMTGRGESVAPAGEVAGVT